MKLTPISVRGKRGQPKTSNKTSAKRTPTPMPAMTQQPETKRTNKHHHNAARGIGSMLSKHVPRLLQLPQEVLERIFVASTNLSLPLVNRELHQRLSTDSIRYQLVGAAFGPTWAAWYGLDACEVHSYDQWRLDAARIEGNPAFQSAILACPWATLDVLLTSFDVWSRQHAPTRAYFTVPKLMDERLIVAPQTGSLYDQTYNAVNSESSGPPRSPHLSMRTKFAFDWDNFQRFVADASRSDPRLNIRALLGTHTEVHPGAAIPDDLLAGPFESEDTGSIAVGEEKVRRLLWLVRGGACLQDEQSWEVSRNGFLAIIQLVWGSRAEGVSQADSERRLGLASQLFFLFDMLGVFTHQWPSYILKTHLDRTLGLNMDLVTQAVRGVDLPPAKVRLLISVLGTWQEHYVDLNYPGGPERRMCSPLRVRRPSANELRRFRADLFLGAQAAVDWSFEDELW